MTSPFIKRSIDSVFKRDIDLMTIQNYLSIYGKIGTTIGVVVGASNFFHAIWKVATIDDEAFYKGQIRMVEYNKDDPREGNTPYEISLGAILMFSVIKGAFMDALWPSILIRSMIGTYRLLPMMTLEFSVQP
jgi:hypothetical protein